jgi:hypothetical protein
MIEINRKIDPAEMPVTSNGLGGQMSSNPQMGVERGRFPPRIAQIESASD